MLKIVDMSEHTGVKGCFAVWNTLEDRFLENKYGEQDFDSFRYFASSMRDEKVIERVGLLLSANAESSNASA